VSSWLLVLLALLGPVACGEPTGRGSPPDPGSERGADGAPSLRIIDGDTLDLDGQRHRLFGIDTPEAGAVCNGADGRPWRCGEAATRRLVELTAQSGPAGPVCRDEPGQRDRYGRHISRCFVGGRDVADQLVREGLGWAFVRYSDDYVAAERAARRAGIGVWQAPNEPAWEWRANRSARAAAARNDASGGNAPRPAAVQDPPRPGCDIKGNISANGRIYHRPGSAAYAATRIATARGERWFCSEREALEAGWRAPRR